MRLYFCLWARDYYLNIAEIEICFPIFAAFVLEIIPRQRNQKLKPLIPWSSSEEIVAKRFTEKKAILKFLKNSKKKLIWTVVCWHEQRWVYLNLINLITSRKNVFRPLIAQPYFTGSYSNMFFKLFFLKNWKI